MKVSHWNFKFLWKTVGITDRLGGPVNKGGEHGLFVGRMVVRCDIILTTMRTSNLSIIK
jgi:hypothetical protein